MAEKRELAVLLDRAAVAIGCKSRSAMARNLGVTRQSLGQWVAAGKMPATRAAQIAELSGGQIEVAEFGPYVGAPQSHQEGPQAA